MEYERDPLEYKCDPLDLQVMSNETNGEANIEKRDFPDSLQIKAMMTIQLL